MKQQGDFDIFSDGLTIYTTVDPKAQKYVYKMLNTQDVINYPDEKFRLVFHFLIRKLEQSGQSAAVEISKLNAVSTMQLIQDASRVQPSSLSWIMAQPLNI